MKIIRVKVKPPKDVIANCGKWKALYRYEDACRREVDVGVVRYEEKDYFVIQYAGKVKECMPL